MAVVSWETLWKHPLSHWHLNMTTATELVGVSRVFPGSLLSFRDKDLCLIGSTGTVALAFAVGSTKQFKDSALHTATVNDTATASADNKTWIFKPKWQWCAGKHFGNTHRITGI